MNVFLSKILQISENYMYLTPILSGSVVSRFRYGPLGELLRQNIRNEWMFSNAICRDTNVFPFCRMNSDVSLIEGVKADYFKVKSTFGGNLPFSLIYSEVPTFQKEDNTLGGNESKYFRPQNCLAMKCVTFTIADDGFRFFHYWLQQRKIWWRKFSANPSRFSLTNISNRSQNVEFANIQAEFPWGIECIETVNYLPSSNFETLPVNEQELWRDKQGKKNKFPCIIESVMNIETAVFTFLCDAYLEDVRLDTGLSHQVVKLHRKLCPYKVAVVTAIKKNDEKEDLMYLAEYVSLNLKKSGIPTLMLQPDTKKNLEELFKFYDLLAIPYIVVLEPSTLSDGLFGLRSRETTLQERLHITNLTDHITLSLKNY